MYDVAVYPVSIGPASAKRAARSSAVGASPWGTAARALTAPALVYPHAPAAPASPLLVAGAGTSGLRLCASSCRLAVFGSISRL